MTSCLGQRATRLLVQAGGTRKLSLSRFLHPNHLFSFSAYSLPIHPTFELLNFGELLQSVAAVFVACRSVNSYWSAHLQRCSQSQSLRRPLSASTASTPRLPPATSQPPPTHAIHSHRRLPGVPSNYPLL
ncbi:hypothetical protein CC80DRAFT_126557 [Byssothecium circinans]|uniref:Uncharacterized protein n=1 Tax=Byssothecium circinans TaxID=147558 RepID=A0A6A5TNI8_9PLEO|nr:hypothetical protein CC80DRAFT_126557 [Byssothecium circinans]